MIGAMAALSIDGYLNCYNHLKVYPAIYMEDLVFIWKILYNKII